MVDLQFDYITKTAFYKQGAMKVAHFLTNTILPYMFCSLLLSRHRLFCLSLNYYIHLWQIYEMTAKQTLKEVARD